jgi:hypothetical protein
MNAKKTIIISAFFALMISTVCAQVNGINVNQRIIAIQYTTTTLATNCPDVKAMMEGCQAKGLGYQRGTGEDGCTTIDCVSTTSTTQAACQSQDEVRRIMDDCYKKKDLGYYSAQYKDQSGCTVVVCMQGVTTTTFKITCASVEQQMDECKKNGGVPSARRYDNNRCLIVDCATGASSTTMPSTDCPDAEAAIKECQAKGLGFATYITGNCKLVQCIETTTTLQPEKPCPDEAKQMEECKKKGGMISRRYDQNKCMVIDCTNPTGSGCISAADIEEIIKNCKAKGYEYVTYEKDGCRYADCAHPSICPIDSDLEYAMRKCKAAGRDYQSYEDGNGCKQVKCIEQIPCPTEEQNKQRIEECKKNGQGYQMVAIGQQSYTTAAATCYRVECLSENAPCPSIRDDIEECKKQQFDVQYYVDDNKCERARCMPRQDNCPALCPSDEDLKNTIMKCEANGLSYEFYSEQPSQDIAVFVPTGCKRVRCVKRACPPDAELERIMKLCEAKGLKAQTYEDEMGCKNVLCTEAGNCPPYTITDEIVAACKQKRLDVESYVDANGCKNVRCKEPEKVSTIECRKVAKGDCIIISCTDGYTFDSCNPQGVCPQVQCNRFKDDRGCILKRCTDGSESKECPNNKPVDCDVYKRDDGCTVKKCTDGNEYVSCPTSTSCKDYVDDKKCRIHECDDGTKTRVCPDGTQDVDCKVYTDEKGCQIKECSNGYTDSSCDKAQSCKESKDGTCAIKTCDDGSITKDCQDKEKVECKTYQSDDGCRVTVCTDGRQDKVCPEWTNVADPVDNTKFIKGSTTTTTVPKETGGEGGFLSRFFRSLGL